MKITILKISIIVLTILTSCNENVSKNNEQSNIVEKEFPLTPINYDFDNLKLTLNSSISDSVSDDFWRWDYMNSDNGGPDSTGIDYFMNHNQPVFSYNSEETLPSLSIKTDKNRIIEFSVTVIFHLTDNEAVSIENLLDSLTTFDLLNDEQIRQTIIDENIFRNVNSDFEEMIELKLSEEEYGYDRITYEIKNKTPHNTVYSK